MSASLNTTRVTTGGSASVIRARVANSAESRAISTMGSGLGCVLIASSHPERMPAPVFVDQIFGRVLAERAEPLRTICAHPDEVAGFHRVPSVAEAIDAAAFEHQQ